MNNKDPLLQLVQAVFPDARIAPDERDPYADAIYVKQYATGINRAICMFDDQWCLWKLRISAISCVQL